MNIEILGWDSDFFGVPVGRLTLSDDEGLDTVEFRRKASAEGLALVYVMKLQRMLPARLAAEAGLELMDIQLTMSQPFDRERHAGQPYELRTSLSTQELEQCYVIAEQTAKVSRFYEEPWVGPEKTKALYRRWVDNSLNGTHSNGIFVIKYEGRVVGIHLIKTDHDSMVGHCSVIGVEAACKRSNVGRRLLGSGLRLLG
jgi:dTDP-4-amino-4,6-dideoxy-D-galactose acyltransferase